MLTLMEDFLRRKRIIYRVNGSDQARIAIPIPTHCGKGFKAVQHQRLFHCRCFALGRYLHDTSLDAMVSWFGPPSCRITRTLCLPFSQPNSDSRHV